MLLNYLAVKLHNFASYLYYCLSTTVLTVMDIIPHSCLMLTAHLPDSESGIIFNFDSSVGTTGLMAFSFNITKIKSETKS